MKPKAKGKSFFDLSEKEKRKIVERSAKESNKAQAETMKKNIVNRVVWDKPKANGKKEVDPEDFKELLNIVHDISWMIAFNKVPSEPHSWMADVAERISKIWKKYTVDDYSKSDIAKLMRDNVHLG